MKKKNESTPPGGPNPCPHSGHAHDPFAFANSEDPDACSISFNVRNVC